ncbi:MAG: hypothetical protein Q8Q12_05145 [bacterium]|nr:hypothetical protein [bacterium]
MKSLFVVALSALALSGCSLSQERPDLAALIRALQGDATYKETCLLINRTSHDLLVGQNAYLVKDCGSGSTQSRTVREGESLGDVIAELDGQVQNRSGVFFLVRGIGETEEIFYGQATQPAASGLRPIAGDLLVIDPPPTHLLFKEYEGTR